MERERLILSNRAVYTLIVFGIIIIFGIGVYAYESYMGSGNASVMGHVAGEINVQNWSGDIVTLQNIVDDYARQIISLNRSLSSGGGGTPANCQWVTTPFWQSTYCPAGKVVQGIYTCPIANSRDVCQMFCCDIV